MHGTGNDFILINEYNERKILNKQKSPLATKFCERRYGIGSDGIIFLLPPTLPEADIKMQFFNPDGKKGEMCGNGLLCLAKFAKDKHIIKGARMKVETLAGIRQIEFKYREEFLAKVNMGSAQFTRNKIPAKGSGTFLTEELYGYKVNACNTGVPHAVIFVERLEVIHVEKIGRKIRHHPIFPDGTNVNFVSPKNDTTLQVRTYERGVEKETLCCGTGAVASAAIAKKTDKINTDNIVVEMKGGPLTILFQEQTIYMKGTAQTVFTGYIPITEE